MTSRRSMLKALGLGTIGFLGGILSPRGLLTRSHAQVSTADQGTAGIILPDRQPLQIPPLLSGTLSDGKRILELQLRPGNTEFFPGIATPTIGINGSYLGPTLRCQRDDLVQFNIQNALGEPTSIHWHGLHVPARSDGGPRQVFGHGESWDPLIRIMQPAGTFWYHSHMMHKTGEQVYHGLAGMMIIDDKASDALPLPANYGVDDIPLIIQDRRFKKDGSFDYMSNYDDMVQGMQGDTILVNGTVSPSFVPQTEKVRLRILNAANARKFMLAFSDRRQFQLIASDGGLLTGPVTMDMLMLSPGERVEIVVDFSDGQRAMLVNVPMIPDYPESPGAMSRIMRNMGTQAFDIIEFRPAAILAASAKVPTRLAEIVRMRAQDAAVTRQFKLQMGAGSRSGGDRGPGTGYRNGFGGGHGGGNYYINGRQMEMEYINERVRLGDTEIWEIYNDSPMPHPFHVHSGQFQILDRDGSLPPPHEMGYKDTVAVGARERVRIIMRFADFSDPENTYMYHCHMLEHEDRGMMGQFLVV